MEKHNYFLTLAEELNITKAAERLFLSQQNLSLYLKNLEESYGVVLFKRKPRLTLTPAGEALLRTYKKMDFLEKNLKLELSEIESGKRGTIALGVPSTRSTVLIPDIISEFLKTYPGITFHISDGLTSSFEDDLLTGKLNFFIGVSPKPLASFKILPLVHEKMYMVISDELLEQYFPDEFPACKERFKNGVNLNDFTHVPFILQGETNRVSVALSRYLQEHQLKLDSVLTSNNGELRIAMSGRNMGASFCTQMRFSTVETYNKTTSFSCLNIFPVMDLEDVCDSYIVYNEDIYLPQYMKYFLNLTIKFFSEKYR